MKLLFWILFTGALIMAGFMRYEVKRLDIKHFNTMDFEYPADREELNELVRVWSLDPPKEKLLTDQLGMDYIFMSFLYPAILVLCFWARRQFNARMNLKKYKKISWLLMFFGGAQLVAWGFDFCENARLETWLSQGGVESIFLFKEMVLLKFVIGIMGFLLAAGVFIFLSLHSREPKI